MNSNSKFFTGLIIVLAVVFGLGYFLTHSSVIAEPGQEVVLVDNPYFFGHSGPRAETLKEGRILVWNTTKAYKVDVTPQTQHVEFNDLSIKNNYLLDFDSSIQYRVTDPVVLIKEFRTNWFENNVARQYSQIVRNAVKDKDISDMMSNSEVTNAIDAQITTEIRDLVAKSKLPIEIIGISLGKAQPEKKVLDSMNQTAIQQQRKKTLVASEEAEKQRKTEQAAKAEADQEYQKKMGLNTEQFVQLKAIEAYSEACKVSKNCILMQGGNATPVVSVN
ncbi:SPFH domain-containing protein [Yersinia ruckeri]|uniref:SPFH domain-containing protein n=1 Tax=Yersinia ruckeri TaxID=29486 RepID=UPI002238F015|nr:SPFH domain-containing protein [Yersinia ruckeri]MCW6598623.1 SPFH domain-containing protein [Yersinia ruckeri]